MGRGAVLEAGFKKEIQVWAKETTELPSSYSLISLEQYRAVNSLGSILSEKLFPIHGINRKKTAFRVWVEAP